MAISARRAKKLASRCWELPQTGLAPIKQFVLNLEQELKAVLEDQPHQELIAERDAVEKLTAAQALQLKHADLQKAIEAQTERLRPWPFAGRGTFQRAIISMAKFVWRVHASLAPVWKRAFLALK